MMFIRFKMNKWGILLISAITISEVVAQYFIRKYHSDNAKYMLLGLASILYLSIVFMLLKTYEFEKMAIANVLWNGLSTIAIAMIGYYAFEESLSFLQIVGFGVIIFGILLINI